MIFPKAWRTEHLFGSFRSLPLADSFSHRRAQKTRWRLSGANGFSAVVGQLNIFPNSIEGILLQAADLRLTDAGPNRAPCACWGPQAISHARAAEPPCAKVLLGKTLGRRKSGG